MMNFGKTAAALSALALVATPVVASAAPAGASALSLANAPVARSGAKTKKGSKVAVLPVVLLGTVVVVGGLAAGGVFDSGSN